MTRPEGPPAPSIPEGAPDPPALQVTQAPHVPQALHQPLPHRPPLNWSHFKPKFSGKPSEDTEAHFLKTNNWMDTYRFQDNDKVQRFCLTLTGEARL